MRHYPVIIIGGGVTGIGILRDLSMRGIKALLVEQADLANGASSRFHGLLHSGGRYAVNDPAAGKECIEENMILRKIAPQSIEFTEGFFARTEDDDLDYEERWVKSCADVGINTKQVSVSEALKMEPNLNKDIKSVYIVPDSAVDGFRLIWHNAKSAVRYGGEFQNYSECIKINSSNGQIKSIVVRDYTTGEQEEIACDFLVNAAGSWSGKVAQLAGLTVNVSPDRGLLIAFNHRFTDRVINRLHKSGDGDIFVPHGSITILGTTSVSVDDPGDHRVITEECLELIDIGKKLFPDIESYRMLRGFAGTRPLYTDHTSTGRSATRNFVVIDHESKDGLKGMASTVGGKFTTYRLMAEKLCDLVASKLSNNIKCRTAEEVLIPEASDKIIEKAKKYFPFMGVELAASRQGADFESMVTAIEEDNSKRALLCECELVTMAEFTQIASEPSTRSLADVRRRTRLGMGTCQGSFCGFRGVGAVVDLGLSLNKAPNELLKDFVQERWHGIRPMLWGMQLKETELNRGIYSTLLNIDGAKYEE